MDTPSRDTGFEQRYRAVSSRDPRFDGIFFTAVRTTGIYCRPSCPARTPLASNIEFHSTAAAAEAAGFRACRRCRPDATPGSPEWNVRTDVVAGVVRLVQDGVVDREGVPGLARRLGYSERHLTRVVSEELGVGPLALARSQRARTARVLVETTDLPLTDVAFAAGFSSVRQFNDAVRAAFAMSPRELRRSAGRHRAPAREAMRLRLAVRQPFHAASLAEFLTNHAVPGLEHGVGSVFARTLNLPHGAAAAEVTLHDDHVTCRVQLTDSRDLTAAVARVRRLLDLDADPVAVDGALGGDALLAPLVAARPGLRVPGTVDAFETVVRTIVGQQVSIAGAGTVLGRLVHEHGASTDLGLGVDHGLDRIFPTPEALAAVDPATLPMPRSRARTLVAISTAVSEGRLRLDGSDRDAACEALLAQPGIGPWTVNYVRMRGLGDPDVLLDTDLVLRRALQERGATAERTRTWSPWRSYAGMHLWAAAADPRERGSGP